MSLFDKFTATQHEGVQDSHLDIESARRQVETDFAELAYYTLDLKRGLQCDEFQLLYLPKIDLASGDLLAVKAVLRWQHPHRGLLPPQSFIQYAEKAGFMPALGNWMMEQVLKDINEMRSMGLSPLPVTIALTEKQCQSPNLVSKVTSLISDDALQASDFSFEVPKNLNHKDDPSVVSNLRVLRWLGVEYTENPASILDEIDSQIFHASEFSGSSSAKPPKIRGYCYGSPRSFEQICENLFDRTAMAI